VKPRRRRCGPPKGCSDNDSGSDSDSDSCNRSRSPSPCPGPTPSPFRPLFAEAIGVLSTGGSSGTPPGVYLYPANSPLPLQWGSFTSTDLSGMSFSGSNIIINRPGMYNVDFRGFAEMENITESDASTSIVFVITTVSGTVSNPLGAQTFTASVVPSSTDSNPSTDHFSLTFNRLITIPKNSGPGSFSISVYQTNPNAGNGSVSPVSGFIVNLNGSYTVTLTQLQAY